MKNIFFLFPIFLIGIIPIINAQIDETLNIEYITDKYSMEKQKTVKPFSLTEIEDGSKIESTVIDIFTNQNGICSVFLTDSFLNEIKLSDDFSCSGTHKIRLNELANSAVKIKTLHDDSISFTVKKNNIPIESDILESSVSFVVPTYFAQIENEIVTNVIVADNDFVNSQPGQWIETKQGLRANFASIGYTYDGINDVFVSPKPFDSWVLNADWQYESPVSHPMDGNAYIWNEKDRNWDLVK